MHKNFEARTEYDVPQRSAIRMSTTCLYRVTSASVSVTSLSLDQRVIDTAARRWRIRLRGHRLIQ